MVQLNDIEIQDFLAISHLEMNEVAPVVLLTGANAAGKTSFTRAIEALVTGSVVGERGSRIDQDRLKHDGMPAQITAHFRDAEGDVFGLRRTFGSSHKLVLLRGDEEIDLKVGEWDDHCQMLFGAKPEMLRAVLRSDRFLSLNARDQVRLICTILDLEVGQGDLLEMLSDEAKPIAQNLLSAVKDQGADLLDKAADIAVANRRKAKALLEEAQAELAAAEKALAEVEARWPTSFATLMTDDEIARREEEVAAERERSRSLYARAEETRREIERTDAAITGAASEFATLRSEAEKADEARAKWERTKGMLSDRIRTAEIQIATYGEESAAAQEILAAYDRKYESAISRQRMLTNLFAAVQETDDEQALCPLCLQPTDPTRLRARGEQRRAANARAVKGLGRLRSDAAETALELSNKVARAEAMKAGAQTELNGLGQIPPMPDEYRKMMGPVRQRRHEMEAKRNDLISQQANFAKEADTLKTDEELAALEQQIERHARHQMLLKSAKETVQAAEEKVERLTGRRETALEIANEWTPTGLATRLVVERMEETLDMLNALLASKEWTVTIGPEMQIIVKTPNRTETPDEMSRGEQIYLAAAIQATFAATCGFGVVTVDDASALDERHTMMLIDAAVEVAPDVTWIIARHHGVEHQAAEEFAVQ
jgi:recombinational DNA repair ATPase RecF